MARDDFKFKKNRPVRKKAVQPQKSPPDQSGPREQDRPEEVMRSVPRPVRRGTSDASPPRKEADQPEKSPREQDRPEEVMRSVPRPVRRGTSDAIPPRDAPPDSGGKRRESVVTSVPRPVQKGARKVRPPGASRSSGKSAASSPQNPHDTAVMPAVPTPKPDQAESGKPKSEEDPDGKRVDPRTQRARARVRINMDVEVVYKFISVDGTGDLDQVYRGKLLDISTGGTLFSGALDPALEPEALLTGEYLIGMNLLLPFVERPVKVLGRTMRVDPDSASQGRYQFGVKFENAAEEVEIAISNFLISLQISSRKRVQS